MESSGGMDRRLTELRVDIHLLGLILNVPVYPSARFEKLRQLRVSCCVAPYETLCDITRTI